MAILNGSKKNDTLTGGIADDQLYGRQGNDILNSGDGNDLLFGDAGSDTLSGGAGNDYLDAGTGADSMTGGSGNDIYVVDNTSDIVNELADEGTDTVQSSISYTLGNNLENLVLMGAGDFSGNGNAQANELYGNDGNNTLDGKAGADKMAGGDGDDTYVVDNSDTVVENAGEGTDTVISTANYTLGANLENLTLTGNHLTGIGNELNNVLTSASTYAYSEDVLNGGAGADTMSGGVGNDTYYVDNAGDVVVEVSGYYSGIDTVISSVSHTLGANVENLKLVGTGLVGTGNALNNTYTINNTGNSVVEAAGGGSDTVVSSVNYTLDANVENLTLVGAGLVGTGNALDNTYTINNTGNSVVEAANGGTDTVVSSVNYTLDANVENLTLTGNHLTGIGNELNNVLTSASTYAYSEDVLNGGAGADTMSGGVGNDTYYVDNIGDVVVEVSGYYSGIDTVISTASHTLGANVENLKLVGTGLVGTGNALNNTYTINNTGNSVVEAAGEGSDTVVSSVNYTLDANVENLTLVGAGLIGTGNALDNTFTINNTGNSVVEAAGAGTDTVVSSVNYTLDANVENLTLTGNHLTGIGNELNNVLTSASTYAYSEDVLNGGAGADTMSGGVGNDTYYVDNTGDVVVEVSGYYSGIDTVISTASHTLGANVENLKLVGTGLVGTGNALNNTYTINDTGNAVVEAAGGGSDTVVSSVNYTLDTNVENLTLVGAGLVGTGNALDNTFTINNTGNSVVEAAGAGTDTVVSSVNYTLDANVENLTLTGNQLTGIGNELNNVLTSASTYAYSEDVLNGGAGADTMSGGVGNDTYYVDNIGDVVVEVTGYYSGVDTVISTVSHTLGANVENLKLAGTDNVNGIGNAVANTLTGNAGNNVLTGGGGNDIFRFETALNPSSNLDTITDFATGVDDIYLENAIFSSLTATGTLNANYFIGGAGVTSAADANDYLIYDSTTGALYYDQDGTGSAAAIQFATLSVGLALSAADFVVY